MRRIALVNNRRIRRPRAYTIERLLRLPEDPLSTQRVGDSGALLRAIIAYNQHHSNYYGYRKITTSGRQIQVNRRFGPESLRLFPSEGGLF